MRRILFLMLLVGVGLHGAEINECKVDLYYANGIMMQDDEDQAKSDWQDRVDDLLSKYPAILSHIGNVDVAYNISKGMAEDLWESFKQRVDLDPTLKMTWQVFKNTLLKFPPTRVVAWLVQATDTASDMIHDGTLNTHIAKYKESIRSGHGVVVVAHSQGNLFVHEAYNRLVAESPGGWMGRYFHTIAVATPDTEIVNGGKGVSFTNDIITTVGMSGNLTNPNKRDRVYFPRNALGEINGPRTLERNIKSIQYHGFAYYLGYPVFEEMLYSGSTGADAITRRMEVKTDVAKDKIEKWIVEEIDDHLKRDSQWVIKGGGKKKKKCKLKNCKSKRERLTHRFDPRHMDAMLNGALVLPFDDDGKVYPVGGAYVKASCGGTSVTKNPEEGICFRLEGTGETIEGEDGGPSQLSIKKSIRPVSTTLSWDKASDVAMSVSMSKNPGGPPKVGDVYKMNASGGLKDGSQITAECLQDDPIHIIAKVNTPNDWGLSQYEITDPGQLDLKTYGIVVVESSGNTKYHHGGSGGSGGSGSTDYTPVRKYNKCQEKKNKKTCGCVPCRFMVYGMQKTSQYGPIAEGDVTIIPAEDGNKANPQVLYHTETTADRDTLKTGIININQGSLNRFEDDRYYIVRVQGGVDVDSDDDFIYDDMPTRNYGTIHAIVKGRDLKKMPFVVNVLTEAIYQVSGDMLGEMYDASELSDALDEKAARLINTKLDITSTHKEIDYKDVLLWTPAADKYTLIKPYKTYVQPIVEKTYSNSPRSNESYELIYGEYNTSMPILAPLSLEIQAGLPNQTPIAKVSVKNDKNYAHIEIDGTYADAFAIGDDGLIRIARTDTITEGGYYDLRMRAIDDNGSHGSWAGLLIRVNGEANMSDSAPILQTVETYPLHENAPEGTKVAQVVYTGDVTHYHLVGTDGAKFSIDSSGTIRVANGADIDYESSPFYTIGIVATNDRGISSSPFEVKVPVMNEMDTPALPVQITKTILENVPIGTEVTTIEVLREGESPIKSFKILNPRMPFGIDKTGMIYTTAPIDYEETKSYTFMVIATTHNGNSNKVKCTVIVKDVEPESSKTLIDNAVFSVDENITRGSRIGFLDVHTQGHPVQKIILSGKDAYAFRADANGTLYLSDYTGLDYESQRRFVFGAKALDETGCGKEAKIVIEVVNIPDTPPILGTLNATVTENVPIGTVVGSVPVVDTGEGNITGYTLSGSGSEGFNIDANGTIRVVGAIDYEQKQYYSLLVIVQNSVGESKPANVNITVQNIPDAPPILREASYHVREDVSIGTIVGTVAWDTQKGDAPDTYALDDNTTFTIDNNGTIRTAAPLDYETQTQYTLHATATNAAGTSDPVGVTIHIDDVPDVRPALNYFQGHVIENAPIGTVVGTVAWDSWAGDAPDTYALDDNTTFTIDAGGTIRTAAPIDYETRTRYTLHVTATNAFGTSDPSTATIIVDNVIDDEPVLEPLEISIEENTTVGTVIGTVEINSTGTSPITQIILTGEGAEKFRVDRNGTITLAQEVDYEDESFCKNRRVSLGYYVRSCLQEYNLRATADNDHGHSPSVSVVVHILNVIDTLPHFLWVWGYHIEENMTIGTPVSQVYFDPGEAPITAYAIDDNTTFTIDANGTIRTAAPLDFEKQAQYTLHVTATNAAGTSDPAVVTIDIYNEPVLAETNLTVLDHAPAGTVVGTLEITATGTTPISDITLTGEGADHFGVARDGTVTLRQAVDRATQEVYQLQAVAYNYKALSQSVAVTIQVVDSMPPAIAGTLRFPTGWIRDVARSADGTRAYLADGEEGLLIVDTSDPAHMTMLSHFYPDYYADIDDPGVDVDENGYAIGVTLSVDGETLYLADGEYGLLIIDVSDPTDPIQLGRVDTEHYTMSTTLSVDGTTAYVADGDGGLKIVDVRDPEDPYVLGELNSTSWSYQVALSSDERTAYVADGWNGLQIIDIQDPSSPYIQNTVDTPGDAWGVTLTSGGDMVYVADGDQGVQLVDVSDLDNLRIIGNLSTGDWAHRITISEAESLAYIADGEAGLQIADISDPTHPVIVDTIDMPGDAWHAVLADDAASVWVADSYGGLQIVTVDNEENRTISGTFNTYDEATHMTLSHDGTRAYVTTDLGSLKVINVEADDDPYIMGSVNIDGRVTGLALTPDEHHACITDEDHGLQIVRVDDTDTLSVVSISDTPGTAEDIVLSGDGALAYVADGEEGVQIFDISDPTQPNLVGSLDTDGYAQKLVLSHDGTLLYLADGDNGVLRIDVSDPAHPALRGQYETGEEVTHVLLSGDGTKLYYTVGENIWVVWIDPDDFSASQPDGGRSIDGRITGLAFSHDGRNIYVTEDQTGLRIVSTDSMEVQETLETNDRAYGVVVSGDGSHVYLADGEAGLVIVNPGSY